jgi:hypothetical protein
MKRVQPVSRLRPNIEDVIADGHWKTPVSDYIEKVRRDGPRCNRFPNVSYPLKVLKGGTLIFVLFKPTVSDYISQVKRCGFHF